MSSEILEYVLFLFFYQYAPLRDKTKVEDLLGKNMS